MVLDIDKTEVASLLSTVTPPETETVLPFTNQPMVGGGSPLAEQDREAGAPFITIKSVGFDVIVGIVG